MFPDPIGARCGGGETGGDAVAGCFDIGEEDVDFGDYTGHINTLVVCHNALAILRRQW